MCVRKNFLLSMKYFCKAISLSLSLPLELVRKMQMRRNVNAQRTCYEGCFSSFPYGTCLLSVSVACKINTNI